MLLELTKPSPRAMQVLRATAYLLVFTLPLLVWWSGPGAVQFFQWFGFDIKPHLNLMAWWPLVMIYINLMVADYIVGRDVQNPTESSSLNLFYPALALLCLPAQLLTLWFAADYAATAFAAGQLNGFGLLGWAISVGAVSGIVAINVGHELVHKNSRIEQTAGGLLLATVGYGTFKPEHVYGHHAWVSTPYDHSSAPRGMNVYSFILKAIPHNIAEGFRLEAGRLSRRNLAPTQITWWLRNECVWWTVTTLCLAVISYVMFGWVGLAFYLGQSLIAIAELEAINYVEHYGLSRKVIGEMKVNGQTRPRYEKVTPMHSWNSAYFMTNAFLLQLQRHSDHHATAARRYQDLQHHETSPQLPGGYGAMIMLALLPPLWYRVIDKRIPVAA